MGISRRLFFGKAAGAVAAGPMAVEAVAKEIGAMSGGASLGDAAARLGWATGGVIRSSNGGERDWIASRLKELARGPEKRHIDHVSRLDPDLVANRSMSLAARMRIQAEREAARSHEREKNSLLERLAKLSG